MGVREIYHIIKNLGFLNFYQDSSDILRTSTISLVISVVDFGSPVLFNSKHVLLVDVQVNEALRKVSGTLKSIPSLWLPVLVYWLM